MKRIFDSEFFQFFERACALIVIFITVSGAVYGFLYPSSVSNAYKALLEVSSDNAKSNERTTVATEGISKKIEGLKKEVSDDPIKELSSRGIKVDYVSFLTAIKTVDTTSLRLLCDSNVKIFARDSDYANLFMKTGSTGWESYHEEVREVLRGCPAVKPDQACFVIPETDFQNTSNGLRSSLYLEICGREMLDANAVHIKR